MPVNIYSNVYTGAKITLADSHYKKNEGDGSVDICVLLKTDIKRSIEFTLEVKELTAEGEIQTALSVK